MPSGRCLISVIGDDHQNKDFLWARKYYTCLEVLTFWDLEVSYFTDTLLYRVIFISPKYGISFQGEFTKNVYLKHVKEVVSNPVTLLWVRAFLCIFSTFLVSGGFLHLSLVPVILFSSLLISSDTQLEIL